MSHLSHIHHHKFFYNKELNHFFLSIAIMVFGESLIGIFIPIYLYQLGFAVYEILLFFLILSFSFVIFSFAGAKIVSQVGAKHAILWSTPFIILFYFGLHLLESAAWIFYILPIILSWRIMLYNYGFHLNYITHSNRKKRGKELSLIGGIVVLITVFAPLIGGFIASKSFAMLYLIGSFFLLAGTIPLLLTKDKHEKLKFNFSAVIEKIFSKKERGNLISFSGYAIETIIGRSVWPVFLIIILVSLSKTGFIIMLSMCLSILVFYATGKIADKHDKIKLLKFGTLLYFFAWVGRIFADTSFKILVVDSYKNISEKIMQIPWQAQSYDLAMKQNYFKFIVGREIIFNLSRTMLIPFLIIIFYIGYCPFIISFIIAGIFSIGYIFINKT